MLSILHHTLFEIGRHLEVLAVILSAAKDDSQDLSQVLSREVFSPKVCEIGAKFAFGGQLC